MKGKEVVDVAEHKVTKFEGVYDPDMNTELYLLAEEEITEAQYEAIKAAYGVIGPDFQIIMKDSKYFLKGDNDIEVIKATVNSLVIDKGGEAVFTDDSNDSGGSDDDSNDTPESGDSTGE